MKYIKTYIGSNYSGGNDIYKCLEKISIVDIPKPTKTTSPADEFEADIYKHEIKNYAKRRDHTRERLNKTYNLIWGQCIYNMISQIE